MATTTVPHRRSFRDAVMSRPAAPVEAPQAPQAPHKVGELVYATVLAESPMFVFKLICGDKIYGKARRRNKKQRSNEEGQKIGEKRPRPCVILSTKHHTKSEWEYELCLLTSFGNKAYSQLDGDLKRLALPVYQNSNQPNECANETKIPAFVITPPLKPRANSYLIGCPIFRSGRCIKSAGGAAMEPEEVFRLRRYCNWIKQQKREVSSK